MERHDGQFVIYSVGPNLVDEHGQETKRGKPAGPDDISARAWDASVRGRKQPSNFDLVPVL